MYRHILASRYSDSERSIKVTSLGAICLIVMEVVEPMPGVSEDNVVLDLNKFLSPSDKLIDLDSGYH